MTEPIGGLFGLGERILNQLKVEDASYLVVGKIAHQWALFEMTIDFTIWDIAGMDGHTGACVTAQYIGIRPRFDALLSLMGNYNCSDKTKREVQEIAKKAQGLSEQRNRAVHDPWVTDNEAGARQKVVVTARGVLKFERATVDLEKMKRLVTHIANLTSEFIQVRERAMTEVESGRTRSAIARALLTPSPPPNSPGFDDKSGDGAG